MAKIIYGVAGQGFGHSTRSKEILRQLVSQGHQVLVFTYGQALFFLDEEFKVFEIPGLGLTYKDNKLVYWQTIFRNTKQLLKQSRNWKKILKCFRDFNPDLIFTDFEPLTAMLAKLQRLPLISIDNQHQMTNTRIEIGAKYRRDLLADRLIIKSMVWGAKSYLVATFFETPITKKNTFLFPPILRQEILDLKPQKQDYILVYQTSDFDSLIKELKKIKEKFVVFGFDVEKEDGNLEFKKYSHNEWFDYLANCKAIIGNAGLSLMTEALYLQKPYLAIPVKKQIEQVINAYYLEQQGYGRLAETFNKEQFENFISNYQKFENNLRAYGHKDNQAIFGKINELIKEWS
ncbi:MAG: MJ1255/VC2487 family glycosyltransferase [Patescibacteria group bacterium]